MFHESIPEHAHGETEKGIPPNYSHKDGRTELSKIAW